MHAARLAEELEIRRVICPRGAGRALRGRLVVSGARRDLARSVLLGEGDLRAGAGAEAVAMLAAQAREELPSARLEVSYDLRYRGQAFELPVPGPPDAPLALLRERFEAAHEERYGYTRPRGRSSSSTCAWPPSPVRPRPSSRRPPRRGAGREREPPGALRGGVARDRRPPRRARGRHAGRGPGGRRAARTPRSSCRPGGSPCADATGALVMERRT